MEVDSKSPLIQAVDSTLLNKFHPELRGRQWSKVCVHRGLEEAALVLVFLNSEGFCPVLWCRRWRAGRPEGACSLVLSWGCRKEGGDHTVDLERCC